MGTGRHFGIVRMFDPLPLNYTAYQCNGPSHFYIPKSRAILWYMHMAIESDYHATCLIHTLHPTNNAEASKRYSRSPVWCVKFSPKQLDGKFKGDLKMETSMDISLGQ